MGTIATVGRLAPSPTGHLHLGHALSFLAAWWSARHAKGSIVLRLEDLDNARARQSYRDATLKDLEWLGLDWDGPLRIQSKRVEPIVNAAHRLLDRGLAYPCTCTRSLLARHSAAFSNEDPSLAPQQGSSEARYPGSCRNRFASLENAERADGREAGLRLKVEDCVVSFVDGVYGKHKIRVARQVGDFLILRRNKSPAYQLSVVVDDHLEGVTEVVRGRDLLDSSARQILVAQALDLKIPRYLHVPLVCDHQGRRLAKRHDDFSLNDLRTAGITPEEIVAWAANALGQKGIPMALAAEDLIQDFDSARIKREDVLLPVNPLLTFRSARPLPSAKP